MYNKLPHASGVYQIRCNPNGKIYIGSAIDVQNRWENHVRSLRRGDQHNIHLQNAWSKYGEEHFEITVLEFASSEYLLVAEQEWIDRSGCSDRTIGFNIYETAGSPGDANAQIWEGFIDPSGNEVIIKNLFDFCRQRGLDFPSMHRLANGKSKLKSYKGWTHKNSLRKRAYVKSYDGFINPDGNPIGSITNLAAFCREHRLEKSHMVAVSRGRIYSYRGWTYNNDRQRHDPSKTYTGFVDPANRRMVITNLDAFCRENGLDVVHMREVMAGRRKSHKGWTWRNEDG